MASSDFTSSEEQTAAQPFILPANSSAAQRPGVFPKMFFSPFAFASTPQLQAPTQEKRAKHSVAPSGRARVACLGCRRAKERCIVATEGSCCDRCLRLKVSCQYPSTSNAGGGAITNKRRAPASQPEDSETSTQLQPQQKDQKRLGRVVAQDLDCPCCDTFMNSIISGRNPPASLPVELLREWTLIAIHRGNMALIGSILSAAAAYGYTLEALLGDGMALTLGSTILGFFRVAVRDASYPPTPAVPATTSMTAAEPTSLPEWCKVLPLGAEPLPSELLVKEDVHEYSPSMTIVKRVSNGQVTFFVSRAYTANLLTFEETKHQVNRAHSKIPPYMHPDDGNGFGREVHKYLWEGLAPHDYSSADPGLSGASGDEGGHALPGKVVKSCTHLDVGNGVRVWMRSSVSYVRTRVSAQLVIVSGDQEQTSYFTIRFQVGDFAPPESEHVASILASIANPRPNGGVGYFGGGSEVGPATIPNVVPEVDDECDAAVAAADGGLVDEDWNSVGNQVDLTGSNPLELFEGLSDEVDDFWHSMDLLVADDDPIASPASSSI